MNYMTTLPNHDPADEGCIILLLFYTYLLVTFTP